MRLNLRCAFMLIALLACLLTLAFVPSPAHAWSTCTSQCGEGQDPVSCSGDVCTASGGTVQCTTYVYCGAGCWLAQTVTLTCPTEEDPGSPDKEV